MNKLLLAALVLCATGAFAQVRVEVNLPLPTITFQAPPPLVVVQPGIQVVEDYDEEVFFHDGWYWVRRDGHWFHARTHTGGWVHVEPAVVPRTLLALSPGAYRHYRREVREERHEDRREDRRERKHGKH